MLFEQVAVGGCQSYLVGCGDTCTALLIDPEYSLANRYHAFAAKHGLMDGSEISVCPDSVYLALISGGAASTEVSIMNSGSAPLNWRAEILPDYVPGLPLDLTGVRCLFTTYVILRLAMPHILNISVGLAWA